MNEIIRKIIFDKSETEKANHNEWLFTNGLGGYASGTISGVPTRRYHSLLTAALPVPLGRMVMFNHLAEIVMTPDRKRFQLSAETMPEDRVENHGFSSLKEFRLEMGIPIWTYAIENIIIEKRVILPYKQNTVQINYSLVKGEGPLYLQLYPSVDFRIHDAPPLTSGHLNYVIHIKGDKYEILVDENYPSLKIYLYGDKAAFTSIGGRRRELLYRHEAERGYDAGGILWNPGFFSADLSSQRDITLVASAEPWETILALKPDEAIKAEKERRSMLLQMAHEKARKGTAAELVFAADQFIITPTGRLEDKVRANAAGDELKTVIAGYHWFTDWGRDTMISLEGLTLVTGRINEAAWILRTFSHYIKDGLIPNFFPEGKKEGLYHTADATLWFFHALDRYLEISRDGMTLRLILPKLIEIVESHIRGTHFGIQLDPEDGLLRQGKEGYQLTWMDAKVEDWVVTPRRGKAVEINALWYNALCLLEGWLRKENNSQADRIAEYAKLARKSFNERFWYEDGGYLYDVVDGEKGNDSSFRPNQIFAISLKNTILYKDKWEPVINLVKEKLLTPVGLRSLAPGSPEYKSKYFGDIRARDAAYHQGTVWAWLIGPFIDAWMKIHPEDKKGLGDYLRGLTNHLGENCIGNISEIFDAEEPYHPRGCVAQAWSVAETLRSIIRCEE